MEAFAPKNSTTVGIPPKSPAFRPVLSSSQRSPCGTRPHLLTPGSSAYRRSPLGPQPHTSQRPTVNILAPPAPSHNSSMAVVATRAVFNQEGVPPPPAMHEVTCTQGMPSTQAFHQGPAQQTHCYPHPQAQCSTGSGPYPAQLQAPPQHVNHQVASFPQPTDGGHYSCGAPSFPPSGTYACENPVPQGQQYPPGTWDSGGRAMGHPQYEHNHHGDVHHTYQDITSVDPTPKRLRGSYRCRRCGQPKKGHVCPSGSGSSPATDNSQYSPAGSQGTTHTPGHSQGTPSTTALHQSASMTPLHPATRGSAELRPVPSGTPGTGQPCRSAVASNPPGHQTFPQNSYTSPNLAPGTAEGCTTKPRPSAAALGIQPTRLSGLGLSPDVGGSGPQQGSGPWPRDNSMMSPPSYTTAGKTSTPSPNGFSLPPSSQDVSKSTPPEGYSSHVMHSECGEQKPNAEWSSQQSLSQGTPSTVTNSALRTPMTGHYTCSMGPSPATASSGSHVASVLQRVLSMSSLMKPPTFDEFGVPRCATFAGFHGSPSAGAENEEENLKPEVVKRSEQDMCMLNILAKLLPNDLLAAAQCCRRWRRLVADVWFSVDSAALILDETKRPSEYVPFVLRKSPKLAHLTLITRRWVLDDQLLLRIASERPSMLSLVIRPDPDIDCRITEFGLSAFVRGCRLLEKVEIGNSFRMGGLQLQSYSLRSLSLLAATSLSQRFLLSCPSLVELSVSFFSAHTLAPVSSEDAAALAQASGNSSARDSLGQAGKAGGLLVQSSADSAGADISHQSSQPTVPGESVLQPSDSTPCASSMTTSLGAASTGCEALTVRDLPVHASRRRVNAVLQQVANMSNPLKRLHVASLHTSDVMVSGLLAAHAQSLRALSFTHSQALTDEGVKLVAMSCKQLEFLDVSGCAQITNTALEHICEHLGPSLNRLLLAGCTGLSARGIERAVAKLPHLSLLDLGYALVSESQLQTNEKPKAADGRRFGRALDPNAPLHTPAKAGGSGILVWEGGSPFGRITPGKRKAGEGEGVGGGEESRRDREQANTLHVKSSSLRCLSLWGCTALQGVQLECRDLRELNVNGCGALAGLGTSTLRSMCPSLRKICMEGLGGSEGDIEDEYDDDYEDGEPYV